MCIVYRLKDRWCEGNFEIATAPCFRNLISQYFFLSRVKSTLQLSSDFQVSESHQAFVKEWSGLYFCAKACWNLNLVMLRMKSTMSGFNESLSIYDCVWRHTILTFLFSHTFSLLYCVAWLIILKNWPRNRHRNCYRNVPKKLYKNWQIVQISDSRALLALHKVSKLKIVFGSFFPDTCLADWAKYFF